MAVSKANLQETGSTSDSVLLIVVRDQAEREERRRNL
jgi:hypothetical protein